VDCGEVPTCFGYNDEEWSLQRPFDFMPYSCEFLIGGDGRYLIFHDNRRTGNPAVGLAAYEIMIGYIFD
jgi:hypothetical protein